jgi:hypothetical protein
MSLGCEDGRGSMGFNGIFMEYEWEMKWNPLFILFMQMKPNLINGLGKSARKSAGNHAFI